MKSREIEALNSAIQRSSARGQVLAAGDERGQEPRGVQDILIATVDGLKGFPEAIQAVFSDTQIQTCIVHLLCNSFEYVGWKARKSVAMALKEIYRATDAEAAARITQNLRHCPKQRLAMAAKRLILSPTRNGGIIIYIHSPGVNLQSQT